MKRAIHIFFWLSVVTAIVVVLARRGKEPAAPPPPPEPSAPRLVLEPTPAPSADAAPAPAAAPIARTTQDAAAAVAQPPRTETDFMRRIRENVRANPEIAVALARQARQEFGDSAESDDRDKLLVDALINLQKIGAARDETLYYYRHHPAGQYRQYLWAMTGARPDPPTGPAPTR